MGYVIAAILVLLIVGGFVLFLVTNATRKSNVSDAGDPGADQNSLGIVGSDDETPAGDTPEHADANEGASAPAGGAHDDRPDVARPVVGGEAEGERSSR
jgi:hypothetical protein